MKSLNDNMKKYQAILQETELQKAYRELMLFMSNLQSDFNAKYPEYEVAKGSYQGYLDVSFFTFTTEELKSKQLKIAVVYLHKEMRFDAWLSGRNKAIMTNYNNKLKECDLGKYLISNADNKMVSIIEGIIVAQPNFDNLDELKAEIEVNTVKFVNDIESILSNIK